MEVRQRVLQLQRERELSNVAKGVQMAWRFKCAMKADDDQLMAMMMKGEITQAQLATLVMRRAGTSPGAKHTSIGNLEWDAQTQGMRSNMAALTVEQRRLLTDAFKCSTILSNIGPQRIRAAIEFFQPIQWEAGQTIIKQGEMGNKLFIVETGAFDVFLSHKGSKAVSTLKPGALLGEIALLHTVPHAATVRCRTPGSMWSLDWKVLKFLTQGVSLRKTDLSMNVLRECSRRPTPDYELLMIASISTDRVLALYGVRIGRERATAAWSHRGAVGRGGDRDGAGRVGAGRGARLPRQPR
jgi:hypothetical protein